MLVSSLPTVHRPIRVNTDFRAVHPKMNLLIFGAFGSFDKVENIISQKLYWRIRNEMTGALAKTFHVGSLVKLEGCLVDGDKLQEGMAFSYDVRVVIDMLPEICHSRCAELVNVRHDCRAVDLDKRPGGIVKEVSIPLFAFLKGLLGLLKRGNVVEGPDSSVVLPISTDHAGRVPVEDAPVFELHLISDAHVRMAAKQRDMLIEFIRVFRHARHVLNHRLSLSLGYFARNLPLLDEALIFENRPARIVNHEESVRGGVDKSFKESCLFLQPFLCPFTFSDVAEGYPDVFIAVVLQVLARCFSEKNRPILAPLENLGMESVLFFSHLPEFFPRRRRHVRSDIEDLIARISSRV